jgi:hypothetical protein
MRVKSLVPMSPHRHVDRDVARRQALHLEALVRADHDVDGATDEAQCRGEAVCLDGRRRHPDRDHDVPTELAAEVDRQIPHHAAVGQDPAFERHRREHTRQRHARAHGFRKIAAVEKHDLAGEHVGRDGAKRNRQIVEVARVAKRRDERADHLLDLLRDDEPARHAYSAATHADLERNRIGHRRELALDRHTVAPALSADGPLPIDREHLALDLLRTHTGRERRADERAHARADDAVDGNAQLVENPQHSYVSGAFRTAAREHEADPRPRRRRGRNVLCERDSAERDQQRRGERTPAPGDHESPSERSRVDAGSFFRAHARHSRRLWRAERRPACCTPGESGEARTLDLILYGRRFRTIGPRADDYAPNGLFPRRRVAAEHRAQS